MPPDYYVFPYIIDKTEDDELDNEFALLANRNKAKKNTNPFKAVV